MTDHLHKLATQMESKLIKDHCATKLEPDLVAEHMPASTKLRPSDLKPSHLRHKHLSPTIESRKTGKKPSTNKNRSGLFDYQRMQNTTRPGRMKTALSTSMQK